MKVKVSRILFVFFLAAFCTGTVFLARVSGASREGLGCTALEVTLADSLHFVSEEDVLNAIAASCGTLIGQRADSVGLDGIERLLEGHSAVRKCEAWICEDGVLHIELWQREPAARFLRTDGSGFYTDSEGYMFPLHPRYTAPVPTVSGEIPVCEASDHRGEAGAAAEREWIGGVLEMLSFTASSPVWSGSLKSVTVEEGGNLTLTTSKGAERVLFGRPEGYREKFSRLEKYYRQILPAASQKGYTSVNVKYNNQIICRNDT